jgi:hypothetical protein
VKGKGHAKDKDDHQKEKWNEEWETEKDRHFFHVPKVLLLLYCRKRQLLLFLETAKAMASTVIVLGS